MCVRRIARRHGYHRHMTRRISTVRGNADTIAGYRDLFQFSQRGGVAYRFLSRINQQASTDGVRIGRVVDDGSAGAAAGDRLLVWHVFRVDAGAGAARANAPARFRRRNVRNMLHYRGSTGASLAAYGGVRLPPAPSRQNSLFSPPHPRALPWWRAACVYLFTPAARFPHAVADLLDVNDAGGGTVTCWLFVYRSVTITLRAGGFVAAKNIGADKQAKLFGSENRGRRERAW